MVLFSEAVQQFLNSISYNKIIKPHTAWLKTKQTKNLFIYIPAWQSIITEEHKAPA